MECLIRVNSGTLSASLHDWRLRGKVSVRGSVLKGKLWRHELDLRPLQVRRMAGESGFDSYVATVKEEERMKDFADEEDFVKAGGGELLFVQMQERKSMEEQSRIADKVRVNSPLLFAALFVCSKFVSLICFFVFSILVHL